MEFLSGVTALYWLFATMTTALRAFGWKPSGCSLLRFTAECIGCGILWPYVAFRLMVREFLA